MTQQKGFTLIELMIVVAIIAILAAIALPAYQDYTIRGQVSEGLSLTSGARTAVTEFYANRGTFPTANASAGLATAASISGQYVDSVNINTSTATAGKIVAIFGGKANSKISTKTLILSGADNGGSVEWLCDNASTVEDKYLPTSCR
jgi:type IV pilus assembly protein PilA